MSWRRSTGHLDANVPDYQKMLQGRYSSSGWSSTQPSLSSYSSRFPGASNQTSGYLSQRPSSAHFDHTSPRSGSGYSNTYQPSKYGLTAESSYNSSLGDTKLRGLQGDHSNSTRSENGFSENERYSNRKFDNESFRNFPNRGTDYSSDSGHNAPARHTTDYSSDSGMSFRRQSWKSSDFELDIPSPDVSRSHNRSQNDDELFQSPVKSQRQVSSEFLRYNGNHNVFDDHLDNHLTDYRHVPSESSYDKYQNIGNRYGHSTDEEEASPRQPLENNDDDSNKVAETTEEEDEFRTNFVSPEMYQGDVGETTVAHRPPKSQSRNKGSDLTQWQQNQKTPVVTSEYTHTGLSSKSAYQSSLSKIPFRDYSSDVESSQHNNDSYNKYNDITGRHSNLDTMTSRHSSHNISSLHHHHRQDTNHHTTSTYEPAQAHRASEQMKTIRNAADAIIRDKDAIINELKDRLESSEETMKEYENKMRRLMNKGPSSEGSVTFSKLQDLEFRNSELQAELSRLKGQKNTEIDELEIKLGGVEHENQQLKTALRKAQPNVSEMKEKLQAKDEELKSWKKKCSQISERCDKMNDKLECMDRYLADLPTLEEFTKNAEDISFSCLILHGTICFVWPEIPVFFFNSL
ncbi:Centrosomal protein [Mactra antiquata]